MTWDDTAYRYTIHALGAVEASMDYGAVNPNDVISVGLLQWYAQRAANVLSTMRTTNPTEWAAIAPSLEADMAAHLPTSSFWSNRYVNREEIISLNGVLRKAVNKAIQLTQAQDDIDNDYIPAGEAAGIDKDINPETMAFFINIYNRNPTGARRIIGNCGGDSSLNRIYSYTINDSTEGNFANRYNTAKTIIANHDVTGVDSLTDGDPDPTPNPGGDGGGGGNGTRPTGNESYIQERGSQLILFNKDNTKLFFQRTGGGIWVSSFNNNVGTNPDPPPVEGNPDPSPGSDGTTPQGILDAIAWELTKIGAFAYSQGSGRLNPVASGYTDCSALHYYAYKTYAATNIGTWTGDQHNHGHLVTRDPAVAKDGHTMLKGDICLFRWGPSSPSTFDHAEMYKGSDEFLSHGGPGSGPHIFSVDSQIDEAISGGGSIEVRRYLT